MSMYNSQDMLGKLLATENIRIERHPVTTASFDVKNRRLILPNWQGMSKDVLDRWIGHEVSHALYTPLDYTTHVEKKGAGYGAALNVIEDVRIEKLIKRRYPGLKAVFFRGVWELVERGFYGCKPDAFNKLPFLDRINIYFKVGDTRSGIKFSDKEQPFIARLEKLETWDEVVKLTDEIFAMAEEERKALTKPVKEKKEKPKAPKPEKRQESEDEDDAEENGNVPVPDEDEDEGSELAEGEENDEDGDVESDDDGNVEGDEGEASDDGEDGDVGTDGDEGNDEGEESDDDAEGDAQGDGEGGSESDEDGDESDNDTDADTKQGGKGAGRNTTNVPPEVQKALEELEESDELYSITEEAFEKAQAEMANLKGVINYGLLPKINPADYIIPVKAMYAGYDAQRRIQSAERDATYTEFMQANKKIVTLLAQQFDMKRRAKQVKLARTAKSGEIDVDRVWRYKFSEDLFTNTTITPDGKNHGMLMMVDMSGSMESMMGETLEQAIILAMFCKKVGIPFIVYGFSDNMPMQREDLRIVQRVDSREDTSPQAIQLGKRINLRELLTDALRGAAFNNTVKDMLMLAKYWKGQRNYYSRGGYNYSYQSQGYLPNDLWALTGTPLDEAVVVLGVVANRFREATGVEHLTTILLSDGDGCSFLQAKGYDENNKVALGWGQAVVTDPRTKVSVEPQKYIVPTMQSAMLDMYRKATGSRLVFMYLTVRKQDAQDRYRKFDRKSDWDVISKTWKTEGYVEIDTDHTDRYFVVNARDMSADAVDMEKMMEKGKSVRNAFRKMQESKQVSRMFVRRFIEVIS